MTPNGGGHSSGRDRPWGASVAPFVVPVVLVFTLAALLFGGAVLVDHLRSRTAPIEASRDGARARSTKPVRTESAPSLASGAETSEESFERDASAAGGPPSEDRVAARRPSDSDRGVDPDSPPPASHSPRPTAPSPAANGAAGGSTSATPVLPSSPSPPPSAAPVPAPAALPSGVQPRTADLP